MPLTLEHLGMSGLRLVLDGDALVVDPPHPALDPTLVTWTEAERVAGVGPSGRLMALPEVLEWLGRPGLALDVDAPLDLGDLRVVVRPFAPIPYATPVEALRKTRIALRRPTFAARRLAHTVRRPAAPPIVVRLDWKGHRIALCQQALHRFVDDVEAAALQAFFAGCTVAIASPDFDDEAACGRLLSSLGADHSVLVDSIGPVRRKLGLPTRSLSVAAETAPEGVVLLEEGRTVRLALPV